MINGMSIGLYGQDLEKIDYSAFLTILRVNGLTAFELNGYVNIVAIHEARTQAIPTVVPGKQYPDDQFVSMSIIVKNAKAIQLAPILRPLMPVYSFMVADVSSNSIILVDTYANAIRIKTIVEDLDARAKPAVDDSSPPESKAKAP